MFKKIIEPDAKLQPGNPQAQNSHKAGRSRAANGAYLRIIEEQSTNQLAERVGFEPTEYYYSAAFKAAALNRARPSLQNSRPSFSPRAKAER